MNRESIKILAVLAMLLNHFSHVFLPEGSLPGSILTGIGFFTAVTMCYFLVEGYVHTSSHRRYGMRLLVMAIVSQVPYSMHVHDGGWFHLIPLNMMFTLLWGFLYLRSTDLVYDIQKRNLIFAVLIVLSGLSDWPIEGLFFVILFQDVRLGKRTLKEAYRFAVLAFSLIHVLDSFGTLPLNMILVETAIGAAMIMLSGYLIGRWYNGRCIRRGKVFLQWFFYLFYPVHLIILGILGRVLES